MFFEISEDLDDNYILIKLRVCRERLYFDLLDCQFCECFRLSQIQVEFVLGRIDFYLTQTAYK